jgi:hypothetical protein
MGRKNGRPNVHIQEKRPAVLGSAPAAPVNDEPPATAPEARLSGWRLAATLWAIVFLFLAALMMFDLIAGLIHG